MTESEQNDLPEMSLEQAMKLYPGLEQNLNFLNQERLWFISDDDGSMVVCFGYISKIDDDILDPTYAKLREICMRHGSPGRIKCRDSDTGPFYAFRIPTESRKDCYEELKRNSA